jgi:gamma-glutamylcyclotransferase (GGCT)/AIG2-like uncharacterized protein YtfP
MPLLFSYGTLQLDEVQMSIFNRILVGYQDELPGYQLGSVRAGNAEYANVVPDGVDASVPGTVYEVTEAELRAADAYEEDAAYVRIEVELASGRRAWVYAHGVTDAASARLRR